MPGQEDIRWGLARRFEFIEWRAYWVGRINRRDLEERFGVSTPQASVDLRSYQEAAPGNIEYNATEKAYMPTSAFAPKYSRLSADRYLLQLGAIGNGAISPADTWFGSAPPADVVPPPERRVEPATLRAIVQAIDGSKELDVRYLSLTSTGRRTIAPHSLAFDGHRWHARAWSVERRDFRDFVLSRIQDVGEIRGSSADPADDIEWNTHVELKVVAHPALSEPQKAAVERDFGMTDGLLVMKTRVALAFYVIKRLDLDLDQAGIPPERRQIFLSNRGEVEEAQRIAKAEGKARRSAKT